MKSNILHFLLWIVFSGLAVYATAQTNTRLGTSALPNNNGSYNTALGYFTLFRNTTGYNNTAIGAQSLYNNTTGLFNTATGANSLNRNTTGGYNTAGGINALYYNTSGNYNLASGAYALYNNTTGTLNTANGAYSLYFNTGGIRNTAGGAYALYRNISGYDNSADGAYALYYNTSGTSNAAGGAYALYSNTTGNSNVAFGSYALYTSTTGSSNTASGVLALHGNTTGNHNTASGAHALGNNKAGNYNAGVGSYALSNSNSSSYNTGIGYSAGGYIINSLPYSNATFLGALTGPTVANLTNIIAIGYDAKNTASNQVRIGNNRVTSIGGYTNWTNISDGRFKKNIKEDVPGLQFINQLRPVTYTLDVDGLDKAMGLSNTNIAGADGQTIKATPTAEEIKAKQEKAKVVYTGFLAQEVKAAADKLGYDFSGVDAPKDEKAGFYGIRYAEFVIPLVKAAQELNKKHEELKTKYEQLEEKFAKLEALIVNSNTSVDLSSAFIQQNTPNPFGNSALIRYHVPANAGAAKMLITDMKGAVVQTISLTKGTGQVTINRASLAAGTYNYTLSIDGKNVVTKQMLISK